MSPVCTCFAVRKWLSSCLAHDPSIKRIGAANASERSRSGGQVPLKRLALGVELSSMSDRRLGEAWPQTPVPLGFIGEAAQHL